MESENAAAPSLLAALLATAGTSVAAVLAALTLLWSGMACAAETTVAAADAPAMAIAIVIPGRRGE